MVGFKALNIESDDESDIEVDDTKEIQIEEALKLYQVALRYHAEGPGSFDKAAAAYQQLFDSEIFRYPESQTELQRIELYGVPPEVDELFDDGVTGASEMTGVLDSGPSTLPQILHLSHKNYAQFRLEALMAKFETLNVTMQQIFTDASEALSHFVQALDKDDSDLDLWRRTASVGEILDSKRVARFCLESVLDGDDENLGAVLSLPGLEEGIAGQQLWEMVTQMRDELTMLQSPPYAGRHRKISKVLKQRMLPYEDLIRAQKGLGQEDDKQTESSKPASVALKAPSNWAKLGEVLLQQQITDQHANQYSKLSDSTIRFDVSDTTVPSAGSPITASLSDEKSSEVHAPTMRVLIQPDINEQFPGLDQGLPIVQPRIAPADPGMQEIMQDKHDRGSAGRDSQTMTLPSRKRSSEVAGLLPDSEETRTKSRRIRARDSNANAEAGETKQALLEANARWEWEQQINEVQAADDWMFETVGNLFERAGIVGFDAARHVRQGLLSNSLGNSPASEHMGTGADLLRYARQDIQTFLNQFNEQLAQIVIHGKDSLEVHQEVNVMGVGGILSGGGSATNTPKLPLLADEGLQGLLHHVNERHLLVEDVVWKFIQTLLKPGELHASKSAYTSFLWSESLKTTIVRLLVNFDSMIWEVTRRDLETWTEHPHPCDIDTGKNFAEFVQTIFEIHLDIYCLIKEPNSGVEAETVKAQGHRLGRWSHLALEALHMLPRIGHPLTLEEQTNLRFLWATTFNINATPEVTQEHALESMNDLRSIIASLGSDYSLSLPNNAIMPELSLSMLDREISKLTTRDFFLKMTNPDVQDPVSIIENLEPLLESLQHRDDAGDGDAMQTEALSDVAPELVRFLRQSDMSVRMMLWQRLRDAYVKIDYYPMVVRCYLSMMRSTLDELKSEEMANMSQAERQVLTLKYFRLLFSTTTKLYGVMTKSENIFECVDERGLIEGVSSLGELLQLLQVINITEDSIRIGQTQAPSQPNGTTVPSFQSLLTLSHDMQIQIWIILYALLQEAISQNAEAYSNPDEDKFDFLRTVHRNLGIRNICGAWNRAFVRMLRDAFFQLTHVDGYESEQAQVLYDVYGLNCFHNSSYELMEHQCTRDAFQDRNVALQTVDLLLSQASKVPMKELVKHSLKETIDKVHNAIPRKKPTEAIQRNRDVCRNFLKSTINPLDLFNCLQGQSNELSTSLIPKDDAPLAAKGWYFMLGHLALTKFRSQKRTGPTPIDDIDLAIAYFNQELEYTVERWETWFRLAQAYDNKIEENVVWSAERLNNNMQEIVAQQRAAIHCYTMATALANRSEDFDPELSSKMHELHTDFAMRLYASSREPFSMLAFSVDDSEKFFSTDRGIGKGKSFQPVRVYTTWRLANALLKRAIQDNPNQWGLYYMTGKCLWKMHAATEQERQHNVAPAAEQVVDAFVRVLELLPDKKDSRESKRDPLLEPHYKLLSIVHKLFTRGSIGLEQAKEALEHTPYAARVAFPQTTDEWVPYVLAVLKRLRTADKSNWYHRMIARTAQIIYDETSSREDGAEAGEDAAATGAKHELTQQMFTKTMVLQVWRPEGERAGRHFVYTTRYTRFFIKILKQLKDRSSLEMIARRVRRRPNDFFEHSLVWQEICVAYLQLLRDHASLPEGLETTTFGNLVHDEFLARRDLLEHWMQAQDPGVSPALDVLRDVQELKKINLSLMKIGSIDDLIGDAYAYLFNSKGKQLVDEERRVKQEAAARATPTPSPQKNPMMSLTHVINGVNGGDAATAAASTTVATNAPSSSNAANGEPGPTKRKVGVGRREIRACAEACGQKAGGQTPGGTGATRTQATHSPDILSRQAQLQVVIERRAPQHASDGQGDASVPGSIQDSADDESELSELEDEDEEDEDGMNGRAVSRPMFPGLKSTAGTEEGKTNDASDDEGESEGEGEDGIEGEHDDRNEGEGEGGDENDDANEDEEDGDASMQDAETTR